MKLSMIILLAILAALTWHLVRARAARVLRVATLAYLGLMGFRLATTGIDQDQLQVAGLSFAFFAGIWALAWLATRSAQR